MLGETVNPDDHEAIGKLEGFSKNAQAWREKIGSSIGSWGASKEQELVIKATVQTWRELPENQLWDRVADYADEWNPTVQSQIVLMSLIKDWNPTVEYTWDASDKVAAIEKVEEAFFKTKRSSDIYRVVKQFDLPRIVAADVCDLALSQCEIH